MIPPADLAILDITQIFKPCQVVIGVAVKTPNHDFGSQIMIMARDEAELKIAVDWFKQRGKFNRLDMQRVAIIPLEAIEDPDEL